MLVSMAVTMAGLHLSAVPQAVVNAAQLVIGVSLGVRFRAEFLRRPLAGFGGDGTFGLWAFAQHLPARTGVGDGAAVGHAAAGHLPGGITG